jgi:hypothetical protein
LASSTDLAKSAAFKDKIIWLGVDAVFGSWILPASPSALHQLLSINDKLITEHFQAYSKQLATPIEALDSCNQYLAQDDYPDSYKYVYGQLLAIIDLL